MADTDPIALGWYVPQVNHTGKPCPSRWVLRCANGWIYYSTGTKKRFCKVESFHRWVRRRSAIQKTTEEQHGNR